MVTWANVYETITLSPPKIKNAFDENMNLSDSFKKLCEHQGFVKLIEMSLFKRSVLFDYYADKMNLYGGEV